MRTARGAAWGLALLAAAVLTTAAECGPPGGGSETKFRMSVSSGGTWAENAPASIGVAISSTINDPYTSCDFNIISSSTTVRTVSAPVTGSGREFAATVGLPAGALKAGAYSMDAWCNFSGGRWYSRTSVSLTVLPATPSASPSPSASASRSASPSASATASSSASAAPTVAPPAPATSSAPAPSAPTSSAPAPAPSSPSQDPSTPAPAPSTGLPVPPG